MSENYKYVKNSRERLKKRAIYVMGDKCQICGYSKCNTALEFHHIDPHQKEFSLSTNANLGWEKVCNELMKCTLVCANCHREIEAGLIESPKCSFISERAEEITQTIKDLKTHKIYYCKNCGKEIGKEAIHCPECSHLARRTVDRPSRSELKNLIRSLPFTQIGKQYGVTDNSIRKWCKSEDLPYKKTEINSYSQEEWDLI